LIFKTIKKRIITQKMLMHNVKKTKRRKIRSELILGRTIEKSEKARAMKWNRKQ
jgi:hypothetical protein